MIHIISLLCESIVSLSRASVGLTSFGSHYQPDVRALKQQLHDRKETNGEGKRK